MRKHIRTELTFFIQEHREKSKGRLFSDLLEVDKLAREWEEVNLMLDGIL